MYVEIRQYIYNESQSWYSMIIIYDEYYEYLGYNFGLKNVLLYA